MKQSLQGPVYLDKTANCLIIRSDIFNVEINGTLAIHIIMHNLLLQIKNTLKFQI